MATITQAVTLYTTPFCPGCFRAKLMLRRLNIPFAERDVTADLDAYADLLRVTRGQPHVPTVLMPSGELMVEPEPLLLLGKLVELVDATTEQA